MRIGFFGGTFDPPHNGHLSALSAFTADCSLDRVLVMPTGTPPHKAAGKASDTDRLEMARLAFESVKNAEICDYEVRKGGKSYSVETLEWLKTQFPNDEIVLYTGSDMLLSFHKWYKVERILQLCEVASFSRTGSDRNELEKQALFLRETYGAKVTVHDFSPQIVSSTDVRNAIANGDDISDLVPKKVEEYIKNNALYAPFDLKKAEDILRSRVNEKRYAHCLGVAKTAVYLAEKYGADPKKAEIAGLLHDITKNLSNSEQIVYCRENGIPLDGNELLAPQVIHAKTAEFFVRTELGLSDEEILSAIRYHTTGRAEMTLLDKIIYVSDFIEPTRDYSDVDHYRALADENLDTALLEGLKWIICNAVTNNKPMHPAAIEMFNNLVNNK